LYLCIYSYTYIDIYKYIYKYIHIYLYIQSLRQFTFTKVSAFGMSEGLLLWMSRMLHVGTAYGALNLAGRLKKNFPKRFAKRHREVPERLLNGSWNVPELSSKVKHTMWAMMSNTGTLGKPMQIQVRHYVITLLRHHVITYVFSSLLHYCITLLHQCDITSIRHHVEHICNKLKTYKPSSKPQKVQNMYFALPCEKS